MKNSFTKRVTVLLLPPFFNNLNFANNKFLFISLNEIVNSFYENSEERKNISSFFELIKKDDFSEKTLNIIEKKMLDSENESEIVILNYPSNVEQFENLKSSLNEKGIQISNVIFSNFETFEMFEELSSKFFICPFCFCSFEKENSLCENNFLICPHDGKKFSVSSSLKFSKSFNEHYLKNCLDFAQNLSIANENLIEEDKKIKILSLIIPKDQVVEEFLVKEILKNL